jgi:CTP:molybdopterin cytidylyltransferase MocA
MVAGVVLAAGAATRFGGPKQTLLVGDVVAALGRSSVDGIVVVTGAHALDAAAPLVRCPEWERGPGASLRCGLAALADGVDAAVVALADGPDLSAAAVDRVIEVWRESGAELVAATYGGNRGHPVLIARSAWASMPDEGARALPALTVPCDDLGSPGDVDVPADLPERYRPTRGE